MDYDRQKPQTIANYLKLESLALQNLSIIQIVLNSDIIDPMQQTSCLDSLDILLSDLYIHCDALFEIYGTSEKLEELFSELSNICDLVHLARCGGVMNSNNDINYYFLLSLQSLLQQWLYLFKNWVEYDMPNQL